MWTALKIYVTRQLSLLDKSSLWSPEHALRGVRISLDRFMLGALVVMFIGKFRDYLPEHYLSLAVSQAISPQLWNVLGVAGLEAISLSIVFPRCRIFPRWARGFLNSAFTMGGLAFGIMAAQFFHSLAGADIIWWKGSLIGLAGGLLLMQAMLINFTLWLLRGWMSSSIHSGFLSKVAAMDMRFRLAAASIIGGLPAFLFLSEC